MQENLCLNVNHKVHTKLAKQSIIYIYIFESVGFTHATQLLYNTLHYRDFQNTVLHLNCVF